MIRKTRIDKHLRFIFYAKSNSDFENELYKEENTFTKLIFTPCVHMFVSSNQSISSQPSC